MNCFPYECMVSTDTLNFPHILDVIRNKDGDFIVLESYQNNYKYNYCD